MSEKKKDTFIVRIAGKSMPRPGYEGNTYTITYPGGQRVHALDRDIFERAVKKGSDRLVTGRESASRRK